MSDIVEIVDEPTDEERQEILENEPQPVPDIIFGEDADDRKQALVGWLKSELSDLRPTTTEAGNERAQLEEDWDEWRRMSLARPEKRKQDRPWPDASNVSTPFMFSNINGVMSHVKAALTEKKPRHRVRTINPDYTEHAEALERWLNRLMESPLHINLPKYDDIIPYETARMGTQVVETSWVDRRTQFKRLAGGTVPEVVDKTIYEGPEIYPYRLEDVYLRPEFSDIQEAPVVFLRRYFSKTELEALEYQGFFQDIDKIWGSPLSQQDPQRTSERSLMGLDVDVASNPEPSKLFEVMKTHVRYDADEDGIAEDLVIWLEPDTGTILRAEFNELGVRPLQVHKHIEIPGEFYGVGVGWMLAPLQAEIDTLHNMRINSIHISSLQMFVTRPGAEGIKGDEQFFPLKKIEVEEPGDFVPIKFPNAAAETMQAEQLARQDGMRVTGISEGQLGMPDTTAKSGTSPTLQQFMAQKGNAVLRSIIRNAERAYGGIGMDALLLLVANSSRVLRRGSLLDIADPSDRTHITEVLMMRVEDIPLTFQFSVKSTDAEETEDAKRQMVLTQMQLYTQYFQTAMQIKMMIANPQMDPDTKQFLQKMFVGMTTLTEETLKLYDVENTDELLPAVEQQRLMIKLMEAMRQPQVDQMQMMLEGITRGRQETGGQMEAYAPGLTGDEGSVSGAGMVEPTQMAGAAGGRPGGPTAPGGPGQGPV